MGKIVGGMTMSLDGYVNDRSGSVSRLYPDFETLHEAELMRESMLNTGAVIMGRRTYDMANGDFTGYEYQVPIFVLTHRVPKKVAKGQNKRLRFHFISDGIEQAVARAKAAAGEREVTVVGGASTIRQCLSSGILDELQIAIMPVLLHEGLRLFDGLDVLPQLEQVKVIESGAERTDMIYRVVR